MTDEKTKPETQVTDIEKQENEKLLRLKTGSVTIETATLVRVTVRLRTSPQILLLTDRPSIPSTCHHNPHSLPR